MSIRSTWYCFHSPCGQSSARYRAAQADCPGSSSRSRSPTDQARPSTGPSYFMREHHRVLGAERARRLTGRRSRRAPSPVSHRWRKPETSRSASGSALSRRARLDRSRAPRAARSARPSTSGPADPRSAGHSRRAGCWARPVALPVLVVLPTEIAVRQQRTGAAAPAPGPARRGRSCARRATVTATADARNDARFAGVDQHRASCRRRSRSCTSPRGAELHGAVRHVDVHRPAASRTAIDAHWSASAPASAG